MTAAVLLVAAVGSYLLEASHASTPTASVELEKGAVSGAGIVSDATASGGAAIRFAPAGTAPWGALPLFSDPDNEAAQYARNNPGVSGVSIIAREGAQPVAQWFGGWNTNVQADVSAYVGKAAAAHAVPVIVAYNIPNRDCGGFSAGGAQTESAYSTWIQQFAAGLGNRPAIVIVEPDAVPLIDCLNATDLAARWRELSNAVTVLTADSNAYVYLDAGHSGWVSPSETASRLQSAGIAKARGFSLNVSNFNRTSDENNFGSQVVAQLPGKHFVVDTSRNGNGPTADGQWCNPPGRALGVTPTTVTGNAAADAYLWIKILWQSDGACNGNPPAGTANWPYAVGLGQAVGW
jgi:endoglucanase